MRFIISQHFRDLELLKTFIQYLKCGIISEKNKQYLEFRVSSKNDLNNKIISFFNEYKLQGTKYLDFKDFSTVVSLMVKDLHLKNEGLLEIRNIKSKMNTNRKYDKI